MPLADWAIAVLCNQAGLVRPFDPTLVNPASIDIRLDGKYKIQRAWKSNPASSMFGGPILQRVFDAKWEDAEGEIEVMPDDFVLASTLETFSVPDYLEMEFRLKSSRAREGWGQALAVLADPGFVGQMTLELKNDSNRILILKPGMKMGQMLFNPVVGPLEFMPVSDCLLTASEMVFARAACPYNGHYQNQVGVKQSWEEHEQGKRT